MLHLAGNIQQEELLTSQNSFKLVQSQVLVRNYVKDIFYMMLMF